MLESNGGTELEPIVGIESGNTIHKPNDPTRNGYTFVGWFTSNTFEREWNFNEDVVK